MPNEVSTIGGNALAAYNGSSNPFADAASDMGVSAGSYLKFDGNTGDYTYGREGAEELSHGTTLAADMLGFKRGWICWKDGEVEDEVMVRVIDGQPPKEHELEDHGPYEEPDPGEQGDGWREQAAVDLVSGDGEAFFYKTTSKSGLRALGNLLKDFGKQFRTHPGEVPLIELDATSFEAKNSKGKSIGKKYAPVFKIVNWASADVLEGATPAGEASEKDGEDDPANYEDDAPVQTVTKSADKAERTPATKAEPAAVKPVKKPVAKPEPEPVVEATEAEDEPDPVVDAEVVEETPAPVVERKAPAGRAGKRF